jgi:hypothetical protein
MERTGPVLPYGLGLGTHARTHAWVEAEELNCLVAGRRLREKGSKEEGALEGGVGGWRGFVEASSGHWIDPENPSKRRTSPNGCGRNLV